MRPPIEVRPVQPTDLDGVVALCLAARRETWTGPQVCPDDAGTIAHHLGTLTGLPGASVLVALHDGELCGLLLARAVGPNLFTDTASIAVEAVYVADRHRRRGVGHALMGALVDVALAAGAERVYAAPLPGARGMQRFFVRLGFTPAAAHRVTTTAALQRRLAGEQAGARRPGPRGLEDLIARRRQARSGASAASTASVEVADGAEPGRASITRHVRRAVQTRRDAESSTTIS